MGPFKPKSVPGQHARSYLLFEVCSEILDRAAALEAIILNSGDLLAISEKEALHSIDWTSNQSYLRGWARLRVLRSNIQSASLRLDASVWKINCLLDENWPRLEGAEKQFVAAVDRGITDHSETSNPDSSDAIRDLSTNYLLEEKRFPFSDLFDAKEVEHFFRHVRFGVHDIVKRLAL
jgi:hypothetical protein